MNYSKNIKLLVGLLLSLLVNTSCGAINSSIRDHSPKPFDSAGWKIGDAVERCRMLSDIYKKRSSLINGKSEPELVEMLSEPDLKKEQNGKPVWFYNLECGRGTKQRMAITIISGVGMYGVEGQKGQMTAPSE